MITCSDIEELLRELLGFGPSSDVVEYLLQNPRWLVDKNFRAAWDFHLGRPKLAPVAGRLSFIGRAIGGLALASATDCLDDLVRNVEGCSILLTAELRELAARLDEGRPEAERSFSGFHQAKREIERKVKAVNEFVDSIQNGRAREELAQDALDQLTLRYISAKSKFDGELGHIDLAEQYAQLLEVLETAGYNRLRQEDVGADGQRHVRFRKFTSGGADLWPARTGLELSSIQHLVQSIRNGVKNFESALEDIARLAISGLDMAQQESTSEASFIPTLPSRDFHLVTTNAAFCVIAAAEIGTLRQVRLSVDAFRALLNSPWWDSLTLPEAATTLLRYAKFLLTQKAAVPDLEPELRSLHGQIGAMVPGIATGDHAGLERDLRLVHARVLGELMSWDRGLAENAAREFQAGLDVNWARYDCEARGLGLADLAGALRSSSPAEGRAISQIESYYNEALWHLPMARFPRGRVTVLVNFASFLNESSGAVRPQNQERALRLLGEAIELCEANVAEPGALSATFFREQLATVWLVHGNVLRARSFRAHAMDEVVAAAVNSYQKGLNALGAEGHEQLRGLLRLNLGYAYLEDHVAESDSRARDHLAEAASLLVGAPALLARAQEAEIEAWGRLCGDSADHKELRRRIRLLDTCEVRCRRHGDLEGVGIVALRRAELRKMLGPEKPAQLSAAGRALESAHDAFLEAGILDMAVRTLRLHADVLLSWRRVIIKPKRKNELRLEAEIALRRAFDLSRGGARTTVSFMNRLSDEATCSAIASDLIWVYVQGGADAATIRELVRHAAAIEVHRAALHSSSGSTEQRCAMLAERALWSRANRVPIEQHVADEVNELEVAIEERAREQALRALSDDSKPPSSPTDGSSELTEMEVEVQFVVSAWGGVAMIREGGVGKLTVTRPFPVSRSVLERWLYGDAEGGSRIGGGVRKLV